MASKSKIYTKTGDSGTTGLVGGTRIKKYDIRLECYGTVDELNACIGTVIAAGVSEDIQNLLVEIQNKLFNIGSILASDEKGEKYTAQLAITNENILVLEKAIDSYYEALPELKNFIIPRGNLAASQCHMARTICRRAERRITELSEQTDIQAELRQYINRLSDYLFALSRKLNNDADINETYWQQ